MLIVFRCKKYTNLLVQLDMKYLSPLLLAYEDRMKEKDELNATLQVGGQVSQKDQFYTK